VREIGHVVALFRVNAETKVQERVTYIEVDTLGVVGDKHYNKNLKRSILLTSLSSYSVAKVHAISMAYGDLGENILIDIAPYHLAVGERLSINGISFEVTSPCTICEHLGEIDSKLPTLLAKERGIFVGAQTEGIVRVGDSVTFV
jgi:MOSC domain-containing protein YiiM